MLNKKNLFADLPDSLPHELTDVLASCGSVRIERIVSKGHCTDEGQWYDQDEHEWVVVLKGAGRLVFEQPDESVELAAGDHVLIPAHRRHRVEWTCPDEPTVWLAVFHREACEEKVR